MNISVNGYIIFFRVIYLRRKQISLLSRRFLDNKKILWDVDGRYFVYKFRTCKLISLWREFCSHK